MGPVYKINEEECEAVYFGKMERFLHLRLNAFWQHFYHLRACKTPSRLSSPSFREVWKNRNPDDIIQMVWKRGNRGLLHKCLEQRWREILFASNMGHHQEKSEVWGEWGSLIIIILHNANLQYLMGSSTNEVGRCKRKFLNFANLSI